MRRLGVLCLGLLFTACADGGPSTLDDDGTSDPPPTLEGDPSSPATEAIPELGYTPRADDFDTDHPRLTGLPLTRDVLVLSFRLDATVAEANAVLERIGAEVIGGVPGVADEAAGILVIRTQTETHEALDALLDELEADPVVEAAAPDVALGADWIPGSSAAPGADWDWTADGTGTWGHQAIRLPQAWNIYRVLQNEGTEIPVGLLDIGFGEHEDVSYALNLAPAFRDSHGTSSAGIVGAGFDNGIGTDGVNPFASLWVRGVNFGGGSASSVQTRQSWAGLMLNGFGELMQYNIRVISISLGYKWTESAVGDPNTDADVDRLARTQGRIVSNRLSILGQGRGRQLPLILTSAGNDSPLGTDVDARFNSPFAAAALIYGQSNILAIEAVQPDAGVQGVRRWQTTEWGSNFGGHLSAPGSDIGVAAEGSAYRTADGTSIATPMVAGLASYLLSIDPGLTASELRDLLVSNAEPAADAAPRIDAFGAVLGIDALRGNDRVLRMLVDQDDGTPDGNQRADQDGTAVTETDADGNGGPGDGEIDMSDFRRWRDGYLFVGQVAAVTPAPSFDGPADSEKLDFNGNGTVSGIDELVHPWMDLNGDRQIDLTSTEVVGGSIGRAVTDLEVLQHLFSDPHYAASDLPGLAISGDIVVHPEFVLGQPASRLVQSSLYRVADGALLGERVHTGSAPGNNPFQIYTVAVDPSAATNEYRVVLEVLDDVANVIFTDTLTHDVLEGEDRYWDPQCAFDDAGMPTGYTGRGALCVDVRITQEPGTLDGGEQSQFLASVGGASDTSVTWTAQGGGGTISPSGLYTAPVLAPGATVTDMVVARSVEAPLVSATATVVVTQPVRGRVLLEFVSHSARVRVRAFSTTVDEEDYVTDPGEWSHADSRTAEESSGTGNVSASASIDARSTVSVAGDELTGVTGSISGSASYTASGETTGFAASDSESGIRFEVVDGNVSFNFSGTTSVSGSWDTFLEVYGGSSVQYGFGRTISPDSPPGSIEVSGVLAPGRYWLDVFWTNSEQTCTDCSIDANGLLSYTLTFGGS